MHGTTTHPRPKPVALWALLAALTLTGGWLGQTADPAAAAFPGDNGRIAFQSKRDGDWEIYTTTPRGELGKQGTPAKQLTRNGAGADDVCPAWSPDGKRIAFASDRDGNLEIYVMDANGSNQTRITNDPALDFAPDWTGRRWAD